MPNILKEGARTAEFLVSEANGFRSRQEVTVDATAAALVAGTVLGKISATGVYVLHDAVATDGSQDARAVLYEGLSSGTAKRTIIVRDAEITLAHLTLKSGITAPDKEAAIASLAGVGIVAR